MGHLAVVPFMNEITKGKETVLEHLQMAKNILEEKSKGQSKAKQRSQKCSRELDLCSSGLEAAKSILQILSYPSESTALV